MSNPQAKQKDFDLDQAIPKISRDVGINPNLLRALVVQESSGKQSARSEDGAIGLTQLMPDTAEQLGVDPEDPLQNLRGGAQYLKKQIDRFGSIEKALAAYNAGPDAVKEAGGVPDFEETQDFVPSVKEKFERFGGGDPTAVEIDSVGTIQPTASTQSDQQTVNTDLETIDSPVKDTASGEDVSGPEANVNSQIAKATNQQGGEPVDTQPGDIPQPSIPESLREADEGSLEPEAQTEPVQETQSDKQSETVTSDKSGKERLEDTVSDEPIDLSQEQISNLKKNLPSEPGAFKATQTETESDFPGENALGEFGRILSNVSPGVEAGGFEEIPKDSIAKGGAGFFGGMAAGTFDYLGYNKGAERLREFGKEIRESAGAESAPELNSFGDIFDPRMISSLGGQLIMQGPLLAAGLGTGQLLLKGGQALNVGTKGLSVLQSVGQGLGMGGLESMSNAGETFRQKFNRCKADGGGEQSCLQEANQAANDAFGKTLALNSVTSAIELGAIQKALPNGITGKIFDNLPDKASAVLQLGGASSTEAIQELGQESIIESEATPEQLADTIIKNFSLSTPQARKIAFISAMTGGTFQGAAMINNKMSELPNRFAEELDEQQAEEYRRNVRDFKQKLNQSGSVQTAADLNRIAEQLAMKRMISDFPELEQQAQEIAREVGQEAKEIIDEQVTVPEFEEDAKQRLADAIREKRREAGVEVQEEGTEQQTQTEQPETDEQTQDQSQELQDQPPEERTELEQPAEEVDTSASPDIQGTGREPLSEYDELLQKADAPKAESIDDLTEEELKFLTFVRGNTIDSPPTKVNKTLEIRKNDQGDFELIKKSKKSGKVLEILQESEERDVVERARNIVGNDINRNAVRNVNETRIAEEFDLTIQEIEELRSRDREARQLQINEGVPREEAIQQTGEPITDVAEVTDFEEDQINQQDLQPDDLDVDQPDQASFEQRQQAAQAEIEKPDIDFDVQSPETQERTLTDSEPVEGRFVVADASELRTSFDDNFETELQPEPDAERQNLELNLQSDLGDIIVEGATTDAEGNTTETFDPDEVIAPTRVTGGAPTILPSGAVLSGNRRVSLLKEAARQDSSTINQLQERAIERADELFGQRAREARQQLQENDDAVVAFVPEESQASDPRRVVEIAEKANQRAGATRSRQSKAINLAQRMMNENPEILELYQPDANNQSSVDNLLSPENSDFVSKFFERVAPRERSNFTSSETQSLTEEGARFMRDVLFAAAFQDPSFVIELQNKITDPDVNLQKIIEPLRNYAGKFAWIRHQINQGEIYAHLDMSQNMMDALQERVNVLDQGQEPLSIVGQSGIFSDTEVDMGPITESFFIMFDKLGGGRSGAKKRIGEFLNALYDKVNKLGKTKQLDILGQGSEPTQGGLVYLASNESIQNLNEDIDSQAKKIDVPELPGAFREIQQAVQFMMEDADSENDFMDKFTSAEDAIQSWKEKGLNPQQIDEELQQKHGYNDAKRHAIKHWDEEVGTRLIYNDLNKDDNIDQNPDLDERQEEVVQEWEEMSEKPREETVQDIEESDLERLQQEAKELADQFTNFKMGPLVEVGQVMLRKGIDPFNNQEEWMENAQIVISGGQEQTITKRQSERSKLGGRIDIEWLGDSLEKGLKENTDLSDKEIQRRVENAKKSSFRDFEAYQDRFLRALEGENGMDANQIMRESFDVDLTIEDFQKMAEDEDVVLDAPKLMKLKGYLLDVQKRIAEINNKQDLTDADAEQIVDLIDKRQDLLIAMSSALSSAGRVLSTQNMKTKVQNMFQRVGPQGTTVKRAVDAPALKEKYKEQAQDAGMATIIDQLEERGVQIGPELIKNMHEKIDDFTNLKQIKRFMEQNTPLDTKRVQSFMLFYKYNNLLSSPLTTIRTLLGGIRVAGRTLERPGQAIGEKIAQFFSGENFQELQSQASISDAVVELQAMFSPSTFTEAISNALDGYMYGVSMRGETREYVRTEPGNVRDLGNWMANKTNLDAEVFHSPGFQNLGQFADANLKLPVRGMMAMDNLVSAMSAQGAAAVEVNRMTKQVIENGENLREFLGESTADLFSVDLSKLTEFDEVYQFLMENRTAIPRIQQEVERQVDEAVFQESAPLGDVYGSLPGVSEDFTLENLNKFLEQIEPTGIISSMVSLPFSFARTGESMSSYGSDLAGVKSLPTTVSQLKKMNENLADENFEEADQNLLKTRDKVGKFSLGSLLIGISGALAAYGYVTGAGPDEPKERELLREDANWEPFSFSVPWLDQSFKYSHYPGYNVPIAMGTKMQELINDDEETPTIESVGEVAEVMGEVLTDIPTLYSIRRMVDWLQGKETRKNPLYQPITSMIPYSSLLRNARFIKDPTLRNPSGLEEHIKNALPGYSKEVPKFRTRGGEDIEFDSPFKGESRWLEMINALRFTPGVYNKEVGMKIKNNKKLERKMDDFKNRVTDAIELIEEGDNPKRLKELRKEIDNGNVDLDEAEWRWMAAEEFLSTIRGYRNQPNAIGKKETMKAHMKDAGFWTPEIRTQMDMIMNMSKSGITKNMRRMQFHDGPLLADMLLDELDSGSLERRSKKITLTYAFLSKTAWQGLSKEETDARWENVITNLKRRAKKDDKLDEIPLDFGTVKEAFTSQ